MLGVTAFFVVRAADKKSFVVEEFCDGTHADAADANEMYFLRRIQIDFRHLSYQAFPTLQAGSMQEMNYVSNTENKSVFSDYFTDKV